MVDIFIKEEAKMIAERISAQVFNPQDRSSTNGLKKVVHHNALTGRLARLEEVPAGKERTREQASTLFLAVT